MRWNLKSNLIIIQMLNLSQQITMFLRHILLETQTTSTKERRKDIVETLRLA